MSRHGLNNCLSQLVPRAGFDDLILITHKIPPYMLIFLVSSCIIFHGTGGVYGNTFTSHHTTLTSYERVSAPVILVEIDFGKQGALGGQATDDPVDTQSAVRRQSLGGIGLPRPCIFTGSVRSFWGFAYSTTGRGAGHNNSAGWMAGSRNVWAVPYPHTSKPWFCTRHCHVRHKNPERNKTRGKMRTFRR